MFTPHAFHNNIMYTVDVYEFEVLYIIHLFTHSTLIGNTSCFFSSPARTSGSVAAAGLAQIGSRTALSFAFAFLKRAWRSGEDVDLCSDVLEEALTILQSLPVASMFGATSISDIWLDTINRTSNFLSSVCLK